MISFKTYILQEEFMGAWKDNRGDVNELFVNPTRVEIQDIDNYVRYIIDLENEKLYVWNGEYMIHNGMIKKLQREKYLLRDLPTGSYELDYIPTLDKYIQGHTHLTGTHTSDLYNYMLLGNAMNKVAYQQCLDKFQILNDMDMSWLNKYFGFSENGIKDMITKCLLICNKRLEAYRKFEED